jgi:hypothetical protein
MRQTKQDQINKLEDEVKRLENEIKILQVKVEMYEKIKPDPYLIEALSHTTDAVAHVLSDLKRR